MIGLMRVLGLLAALFVFAAPATAQDGYRIRPGDVLRVEVLEDPGINRSVLVAPDGRISVPLAGVIATGGRTLEQVQAELTDRLAGNFAAPPTVFVGVERLAEPRATGPAAPRAVTVHVMGEVGRPGRLQVPAGTTILQAFAEMGGFSKFAATKRIQLRRVDRSGKETVYAIDYDAIERGESGAGRTVLTEGDVILVPQRRLFE
ncbi:MAG: polysaccharide biosynthesis/export family protein [Gemmobacter sp.]